MSNSPDKILDKLKSALRRDGDFPVRARVANEIRALANSPNSSVNEITELILREPALSTRLLHLVNSAFYGRRQNITTVSQAVVQIGMGPLSDLCAGLVLMQRFTPFAKRGGVFADNLKKSILTSLLVSNLLAKEEEAGIAEKSYLAGTFFHLGSLLLAYYFPQVFEAAGQRAQSHRHDILQSLTEILGISPLELSLVIVDSLEIPTFYTEVITAAHEDFSDRDPNHEHFLIANALAVADKLASAIVVQDSAQEFRETVKEISELTSFSEKQLEEVIAQLPDIFVSHCKMIGMNFLSLPNFLQNYSSEEEDSTESESDDVLVTDDETLSQHMTEIRHSIQNGEPLSSVITAVMEALAYGLAFDRVLLLLADNSRNELQGRIALGEEINYNPRKIRRKIQEAKNQYSADLTAFGEGVPRYVGDPLFEDGWPFVALPIGKGRTDCVGVIYADCTQKDETRSSPLSKQVHTSINELSDLLDRAILTSSR